MTTTAELLGLLNEDHARKHLPFSEDMRTFNEALLNPFAGDDEVIECLRNWCEKRQTCQFGRVAARQNRLHFSILREEDLRSWSETDIAQKIAEDKRDWKQRAAYEPERATHSFVLAVLSPRLAHAAPDSCLEALSNRILHLAGWGVTNQGGRRKNTITGEFLYLRKPEDQEFYGFRFNVDFFAAAGDRRWWHDHRFPGGVAFTGNAAGHMARYREWYEGKRKPEWALTQAMQTVNQASATSYEGVNPARMGKAVWLRLLDQDGRPMVSDAECPAKLPPNVAAFDWTRYEGLYHTDHAVRGEFFKQQATAVTRGKPYIADFSYLYDPRDSGFTEFSTGVLTPVVELEREIGQPGDRTHRMANSRVVRRSDEQALEVAAQLQACRTCRDLDDCAPTED